MKLLVLALALVVCAAAESPLKKDYYLPEGHLGESAILRSDGTYDLFSPEFARDILYYGPAGIITKSGRNIQLTEDLRMVNTRTKRHLMGDSGMITSWGRPIQFWTPYAKVLLDGPSGMILSDGQQIQKP